MVGVLGLKIKGRDAKRLRGEYKRLVSGMTLPVPIVSPMTDDAATNPILPNDVCSVSTTVVYICISTVQHALVVGLPGVGTGSAGQHSTC